MPERDLVNVDANEALGLISTTPSIAELQVAVAASTVLMTEATASRVAGNAIAKGDVLGCARIAGIQAAKRAAELIPTVLPVLVGGVSVEFRVLSDRVEIEVTVEAFDPNTVTMQALTACAVTALTIYDMCKAIDRSMTVTGLSLVREQRGGAAP